MRLRASWFSLDCNGGCGFLRDKFSFTGALRNRTVALNLFTNGQPEKETSFKDEQAQAQKALEVEPPQETYVAEVTRARALF